MALFALTNLKTKQVGIFHQLGSRLAGTVCIQNCLAEKYGNKVTIKRGLFLDTYHQSLCIKAFTQSGLLKTPAGFMLVERITRKDPRFKKSAVIEEYSQFFKLTTINKVIADDPITSAERKAYKRVHTAEVATLLSSFNITFVYTM